MSMSTPLVRLQVEQTVHHMDEDGTALGDGGDNVVDDGDEDLAERAAVDDPHVVSGGLHDLDHPAELAMALVDNGTTDKVDESGLKGPQLEIRARREDEAAGEGLGGVQVACAREAHAGTIGRLGHGFDRRDALSPERGGRDVHAHALDEQKGKASQRSHENLPFGPVGANHTGDVLICGLHGANP